MALNPIGYVVGGRTRPEEDTPIQLLRNPDEQGRVVVFLWLLAHLAGAPAQPQLQVVPFLPCDRGQRVTVFATRHPARPNRSALSVVRLLAVEATVLHFSSLDCATQRPS